QGPNAFFVRDEGIARQRVGFGWMMQYKAADTIRLHHNTLLSIIERSEVDGLIDRQKIFLLGFSQSVSLNYRFAFTHPGLVRGVVGVCGGIPGDWDDEKYKQCETEVLIIAGENDEFYPLERTSTFAQTLERRAHAAQFKHFPVGHVFPRESLPFIDDWLRER